MAIDIQTLRLDGVYPQDKDGNLMLRVKIPAGVLSSAQAEAVCTIAEESGRAPLHLTCRGSIEFHWLRYEQISRILQQLSAVGLTTRGACGGAVRGISCSTADHAPGLAAVQQVMRRIHRYFTGDPRFEGLPKKFKVGVETCYSGGRHLIQDVGLVLVAGPAIPPQFDVWCAGGLGREPQAGFLFEKAVAEERLLPLIEAIVRVYRANTPPPKRLKFLLNRIGEAGLRSLIEEELCRRPRTRPVEEDTPASPPAGETPLVTVPVFAGELPPALLRKLAAIARELTDGRLMVTADQNIALPLAGDRSMPVVREKLVAAGVALDQARQRINFRVCPGSHECRMGLAPTRDLAGRIIDERPPGDGGLDQGASWAICGCPNSCSQPQLADFGIVTKRLVTREDGSREPRFDVYRREEQALGNRIAEDLTTEELCQTLRTLTRRC